MRRLISVTMLIILILTLSACKSSKSADFSSSNSSFCNSASLIEDESSIGNISNNNEEGNQADNAQQENKSSQANTSIASHTTQNPASKSVPSYEKRNDDTKTFEQYEELNRTNPVEGEREWIFRSTDKDYIAPYDLSDLSECCIAIDENDHAIITWNYYYDLASHPEFLNSDEKIQYEGKDYSWFLRYKYEGTCFVEQNGKMTIELKCTNDWGNYVNDEISFKREGTDKLVVISHSGTEFNLFKGDEFNR